MSVASVDVRESLTPVPSSDGAPNDGTTLLPVLASDPHRTHGYDPTLSTFSDQLPEPRLVKKPRRPRTPKLPKDSKVYKVAMATIALRAQGMKYREVADALEIPESTVKTYLKRAHAKGWVTLSSFDDHDDQIDVVLKSKTVRNVSELLDERDKDTTLSAFKIFQTPKADVAQAPVMMALKVQVEYPHPVGGQPLPPGASLVTIREGTIGGAPARGIPLDAEILGEE